MGIDDLVDQVDKSVEQQEKLDILDDLGVESKEDLELLEEKVGYISRGLAHYDKRLEDLENRVVLLEAIVQRELTDEEHSDEEETDDNDLNW